MSRTTLCAGCTGDAGSKPCAFSASASSGEASGSMRRRAAFRSRAHSVNLSIDSGVDGTGPRGTYASRTPPIPRSCTLAIASFRRTRSTDHPAFACTLPHAQLCSSGETEGAASDSMSESHD